MISSVGPKENRIVSSSERSWGGLAFTLTLLSSSCLASWSVLANVGTSVSKCSASPTFFLKSPWTVSPLDEISFTLPFSICEMKSGVYGIRSRFSAGAKMATNR